MPDLISLRHIFVDHSNIWDGARLASQWLGRQEPEWATRISVKSLNVILGGKKLGTSSKHVSGGIPPGMEPVWTEYQKAGFDVNRLFKNHTDWTERGVDHNIIGHMWRLVAKEESSPITLVLASGDGRTNEFGASFIEIVERVCSQHHCPNWKLELYSFDWDTPNGRNINSPTKKKLKSIVEKSPKATFCNLLDSFDDFVYYKPDEIR
jgi:hypothetical protein